MAIIGWLVIGLFLIWAFILSYFTCFDTFSEGLISKGGLYTLLGIAILLVVGFGW